MLAYERMMGVFFEKRRTTFVVYALSLLFYFVPSSIAFLVWGVPVINMSISFITLFIVTLNYESSMKKRFVVMLSSFAIIAVVDVIIAAAFGTYQIGLTYSSYINNRMSFILFGGISYILALLMRMFKDIKKGTVNSSVFFIMNLLISLSSIVILLFGFMYFPQMLLIIFTIAVFGINVFMYHIYNILSAAYEDKLKSALHTQEREYYFTQCQLMQESVDRVKTIRHDMKLHLATAAEYNANGKTGELGDYLLGLLGDINASEVYSGTGNIAFDSIINFKLKTAAADNIKVKIDIHMPPTFNIEVADIVIILGNLLDNALEAVAKVKDKIINLHIKADKGNLFIKIENTFDGTVIYTKGKDGITEAITTRKNSSNHGYGLKNIRQAAKKYHGHMEINHDKNVFTVGVLLYERVTAE